MTDNKGECVQPGDVDGFALAVEHTLANLQSAQAKAAAGRSRLFEYMNPGRVADAHLACYREARELDGPSRAPGYLEIQNGVLLAFHADAKADQGGSVAGSLSSLAAGVRSGRWRNCSVPFHPRLSCPTSWILWWTRDRERRDRRTRRRLAVAGAHPRFAVGRVHPGVSAKERWVAATTSSWLAFTDAGVVLDKRWLAELAVQARAGADVVWGACGPVCDAFFRECAAVAYGPPRGDRGNRWQSIASCLLRR